MLFILLKILIFLTIFRLGSGLSLHPSRARPEPNVPNLPESSQPSPTSLPHTLKPTNIKNCSIFFWDSCIIAANTYVTFNYIIYDCLLFIQTWTWKNLFSACRSLKKKMEMKKQTKFGFFRMISFIFFGQGKGNQFWQAQYIRWIHCMSKSRKVSTVHQYSLTADDAKAAKLFTYHTCTIGEQTSQKHIMLVNWKVCNWDKWRPNELQTIHIAFMNKFDQESASNQHLNQKSINSWFKWFNIENRSAHPCLAFQGQINKESYGQKLKIWSMKGSYLVFP